MSGSYKVFAATIVMVMFSLEANASGPYHPVVVSPLIGDTLDATERRTYDLFPDHPDFRWAVFFRERDYTVSALVGSERDGVGHETMVELRYTILGLRQKIEQDHARIERDNVRIVAESMERRGEELVVYTRGGEKVSGELLSVREDALLIGSEDHIPGSRFFDGIGHVRKIQSGEVEGVVIEGRSYKVGGAVVGAVAGAVIGGVIARNSDGGGSRTVNLLGLPLTLRSSSVGKVSGGAVLGAGIGGLLGHTIGAATSTADVVIAPEHIRSLRSMARFSRLEPDQIRGF
ncbi:MAG: hypothetical protein WBG01_07345 [Bacteroidota bacterium]